MSPCQEQNSMREETLWTDLTLLLMILLKHTPFCQLMLCSNFTISTMLSPRKKPRRNSLLERLKYKKKIQKWRQLRWSHLLSSYPKVTLLGPCRNSIPNCDVWCVKRCNIAERSSKHNLHTRFTGTANHRFQLAQDIDRMLLYKMIENRFGSHGSYNSCDKFSWLLNKVYIYRYLVWSVYRNNLITSPL